MTPNQLPPLPEPDSYQFQHDETGQTMFVDRQQVEWGFEANNPRLHKIGGAFTADQMHAYALAALAQQAQEPVANDRDCPHCNYTGSMHCGDVAKTHGGILNPKDCSHAKLFGSRITTPPAPQVPAPVDEQAEFEAWARPNGYDMRRNDVLGHYSSIDTLRAWTGWQARAAFQSPAPPNERPVTSEALRHAAQNVLSELQRLDDSRQIHGMYWQRKHITELSAALSQPAPSPQAPGRRKGPPGITLEPQGHELPAVPVVSDDILIEREYERVMGQHLRAQDAHFACASRHRSDGRSIRHRHHSQGRRRPPTHQGGREAMSQEFHGLDTAERVCFYEQDFYVLSNFSAFRVTFDGQTFDTSEAAYHYQRFTTAEDRRGVMYAYSAHDAFRYAQENKSRQRHDWDAVKVDIMRDILRAKAAQHEYVRRKLLATGDRELVENSWRDEYWGWGPNRDGQNMLGKLWMEIRAELRAQPGDHP